MKRITDKSIHSVSGNGVRADVLARTADGFEVVLSEPARNWHIITREFRRTEEGALSLANAMIELQANSFIVEWVKPEDADAMGAGAPASEREFETFKAAGDFAKQLTTGNSITAYVMPVDRRTKSRLAQWVYRAGKCDYFEQ